MQYFEVCVQRLLLNGLIACAVQSLMLGCVFGVLSEVLAEACNESLDYLILPNRISAVFCVCFIGRGA